MRFNFTPWHRLVLIQGLAALAGAALPTLCHADATATEDWNAHFQATYIWQDKPAFSAAYSGPRSLASERERSYSFTTTAALGVRPWRGAELYLNPEATQGVPLSNLAGLGGLTNGEMARSSGPTLTAYRARLFLRQSWGLGGEQEAVESGANQLAGSVDTRRLVVTAGNLAILDVFDANAYSHDPRMQFLNWSLMTYGAYDYAADARGYSRGAALEWYRDAWVLRAGRFIEPLEPNQQALDPHILRHYGDQLELEHAHTIGGLPGKVRLLVFRNQTRIARYQDALELAARTGTVPDLNAVRNGEQAKRGFGVSLEQAVGGDAGVFARASWADGHTETYAFAEIDQSLSGGALVKGTAWGRAQDRVGLALARNGLSQVHRAYLAAGGLGAFVGDGRLSYRPENVLEAFYSLGLGKTAWLTLDGQYIRNPAYNAARGPVKVAALRLHTEF